MEELTSLVQYGVVGICMALIFLIAFTLRIIFKFMGNHIDHNTKATQDLETAITQLKDWLMMDRDKRSQNN